ncbi:MAG: phosphatidylserine decarboxylase family protein [Gemmatimonadaceae bacterium]|nr:phosphatidylserine decarboxylase family protein [Gemmatimonadaceae bacterium]
MKVAKEGLPFITLGLALTIPVVGYEALALSRGEPDTLGLALAVILTLLTIWVIAFFRDPEREGPRGANTVISPADGKVIMITEVDEPEFLKGKARRVSIFMNVFNVHVNRYPVDGTVAFTKYLPGKFLNAADAKSSLENEQSAVGMESHGRKILFTQIAGLIARRIVTYSKVGDVVAQGQRMGLIRFGSRVDVYLPLDASVQVALGQKTVAGTTVIANLPSA